MSPPDKPKGDDNQAELLAAMAKVLGTTPPPPPKDDEGSFKNPLEAHDDGVEPDSHPRSISRTMKIPSEKTQPIPDKSEKQLMEKIRDLLKKIVGKS